MELPILSSKPGPFTHVKVRAKLRGGAFIEPLEFCAKIWWYVYGDEKGDKLSLKAIARRLTEMKVPTWADTRKKRFGKKRGRGVWCYSTVGDILASETYAGTWYYGKKGNDREYWLAVEVPAIVRREVWEKAQERRKRNREMAKRNQNVLPVSVVQR